MYHYVRYGETLSHIAGMYGIPVSALLHANPWVHGSSGLHDGQVLRIPSEMRFRAAKVGGGIRPSYSQRWSHTTSRTGGFDHTFCSVARVSASGSQYLGAPWMKTAMGEIGVEEVTGSKANEKILEYFKAGKFWGKDDSGSKNAWCGCFAAWVFKQNDIEPVSKAYRAKEWKNFGKTISGPMYGALGVKSRKGGGHVSFVVGQNAKGDKLFMLGGNQDDKVQISTYPRSVWEAFVVPSTFKESQGSLPVTNKKSAAAGKES